VGKLSGKNVLVVDTVVRWAGQQREWRRRDVPARRSRGGAYDMVCCGEPGLFAGEARSALSEGS